MNLAQPEAHSPRFRDMLRIQGKVIHALFLRELSTRFGRENLGYLWLFLEPAMLGGAVGALHHMAGHGLPGGMNAFVFWVVGYIPYYLFRGVVNRAPVTIQANQSLLYHRRVTALDIVVARNLLEGAAVGGAMACFLLGFGMTMDSWPADPALIVLGMGMMLLLSHGIAMLIAAGSVYTDLFERLVHLVTYFTLPLTGAFFMVFWLPTDLQRAALWIPTVHCFEMVRAGQFGSQVPTTYDLLYLGAWVIGVNMTGMAALRIARRALVL